MKFKIQPIIISLAIFLLCVSIWQVLQIKTMILPSWFLLLLSLPGTICISFALGFIIKKTLNLKLETVTIAAIFIIIFCCIFYISRYRPTYTVIIPKGYVGEVRLFVSNEKENNFLINKYGIGYINRETFDKGFFPKIIIEDKDITKQVKEYSKGALATMPQDIYSYEYLSFSIIVKGKNIVDKGIEELIEIKAIDTGRLERR